MPQDAANFAFEQLGTPLRWLCWLGQLGHSIGQLTALVKTRIRQMQYRPGLLDGFLTGTGLDLTPLRNPHH